MDERFSWNANRDPATQELPRLSLKTSLIFLFDKGKPLVPMLRHKNSIFKKLVFYIHYAHNGWQNSRTGRIMARCRSTMGDEKGKKSTLLHFALRKSGISTCYHVKFKENAHWDQHNKYEFYPLMFVSLYLKHISASPPGEELTGYADILKRFSKHQSILFTWVRMQTCM